MVVIPFSGYRNLEKGVTHLSLGKIRRGIKRATSEVLPANRIWWGALLGFPAIFPRFIPRGPQFCQPMDIIEVVH